MEEEIKKAYMDWSEKGVSYLNCMYVYDIMMDVDEALQTCDTILDEIDLGIDYTSREKDIDRLEEIFVTRKECQNTNDEIERKLSSDLVRLAVIENQLKIITWLLYAVAGGVITMLIKLLFGG